MPVTEPPCLLVLWDIDRTLLVSGAAGSAIYRRAFRATTGRRLERLAPLAGRTELNIMPDMLRLNGVEPTEEAIAALAAALVAGYREARQELAAAGRVLPGAAATLHRLGADPHTYQGVLTGNLREVAKVKLDVFGLSSYLDLEASAYGDDHADRARLVAVARGRALRSTGVTFDDSHTVLLGDTPHDVRAATAAGVSVIGVATGTSGMDELTRAGAPVVLADLSDPVRTARVIHEAPRRHRGSDLS